MYNDSINDETNHNVNVDALESDLAVDGKLHASQTADQNDDAVKSNQADGAVKIKEKRYEYNLKVVDGFENALEKFLEKQSKLFASYEIDGSEFTILFDKLSDIENFYNALVQVVEVVEFEKKSSKSSSGQNRWYAVSVASGRELSVLESLNNLKDSEEDSQLDEIFAPVSSSLSWMDDNTSKVVKACMTPGYVFVKTSHPNHIIKAAKKLDIFASFFKPVKTEEILKLKEKDGCNSDQKHSYSIGDSVYVCSGAFANQKGIIEEIDMQSEGKQLKLIISVFGREISVKVGLSEVRKVDVL